MIKASSGETARSFNHNEILHSIILIGQWTNENYLPISLKLIVKCDFFSDQYGPFAEKPYPQLPIHSPFLRFCIWITRMINKS